VAEKRVVMVEGADDRHVLTHLCEQHGVPETFDITDREGKPNLLDAFSVQLKLSQAGDTFGIVVDANGNLEACWQSVRDRLAEAGYNSIPSVPDAAGAIIEPPPDTMLARVGVWIMPNNRDTGALEEFLLALMPDQAPLLAHAEDSIDRIPAGLRRFSDSSHPKALMHTYLAWQENPGRPYGTAIKSGYLDASAPPALAMVAWLRELFHL